jgi:hypothetical protein
VYAHSAAPTDYVLVPVPVLVSVLVPVPVNMTSNSAIRVRNTSVIIRFIRVQRNYSVLTNKG